MPCSVHISETANVSFFGFKGTVLLWYWMQESKTEWKHIAWAFQGKMPRSAPSRKWLLGIDLFSRGSSLPRGSPLGSVTDGLALALLSHQWDSWDERITPPPFPFLQADLNCNIQDDAGAFYGVTSQYESSENMTVTCSTKVCSFGKQVVEKVEVSWPLVTRNLTQGQSIRCLFQSFTGTESCGVYVCVCVLL